MKKLIVGFSCIFLLLFVSCGEKTNQLIDEGGYYTVNISNSDKVVNVLVMPNIVDSLNTPEDKIVEMAKYIVNNADMNVSHKLTYEINEKASLNFSDTSFIGMIGGTAENSYGVRDYVNSTFYFNTKSYELTKTFSH